MALTPTKPIPLGFAAPDFELTDQISNKTLTFKDIQGEKGTLVMFICNHCPYVKHVINELVCIGKEYLPKGIGMVAINSNDAKNYPEDSPEKMKQFAADHDFPFPYLTMKHKKWPRLLMLPARLISIYLMPKTAVFIADNLIAAGQEMKCL
ncbi:MAG TPA: redoxin domain-containing protein [Bacteroidales bacterium]|nr:redoxin domain-containing protein [Bacteroidales bacterium]